MSVIFQTLKKLRTSSQDEKERRSRLKRHRNIYSFRKLLLSPLGGALAVVVLLIIAGLVASYADGSLSNYFPHKNKLSVLPEAETALMSGVDRSPEDETSKRGEAIHQASETGHEKTRDEDLPESPRGIPVEAIEPGSRPMSPLHLKESDSPDVRSAKYFPPKSQTSPETQPGEIERTVGQRPLPSEHVLPGHEHGEEALDLSGSKTPKAPPELLDEGFLSLGALRVDEVQASYIPPSDEHQVNAAFDKRAMKKTMERTYTSKPVPVPIGLISADNEEASGSTEARTSRAERIYPADAGKAHKINRLVSKIEKSMTIGDMDDAKARIDELAVLKGEQSSYVLKLRAFWHMRHGDFEAPISFLAAVLAQEQDDLEAGINMAIVEIKTHRLDKARKRLAKLREIYPVNTIIEDLIQKIGR